MIDPRDHQNRLLSPRQHAPAGTHWTCAVCHVHNHNSRQRCLKCQRPRRRTALR